MDITTAAIAMNQANIQNEIGTSVLKKVLDITTEQGAELVKIMAQQSGVGQRVDLHA